MLRAIRERVDWFWLEDLIAIEARRPVPVPPRFEDYEPPPGLPWKLREAIARWVEDESEAAVPELVDAITGVADFEALGDLSEDKLEE